MGPGSERYLLSNVLLLIPAVGAVVGAGLRIQGRHGGPPLPGPGHVVGVGPRAYPRPLGYIAPLAVLLIILTAFARQLGAPPTEYPDADAREVGTVLARALESPDAEGREAVPVLLPPPPTDAFNAGYALRILSGHPEAVTITWESPRLTESVTSGAARLWVVDETTGAPLPPAERTERIGRFVVGWPPPVAQVEVDAGQSRPSGTIGVRASGFLANEPIAAWLTAPDGSAMPLPDARADQDGAVAMQAPLPEEAAPGRWAITLSGKESQRLGIAHVEVAP